MQDEAGINRVLTGGAPVDEACGLGVGFRDGRGERLHQRNREISGEGCFARQHIQRKLIRVCIARRWARRKCGRDTRVRQCSCQRGFKIEHALQPAAIRENFTHGIRREQGIEQAGCLFFAQVVQILA